MPNKNRLIAIGAIIILFVVSGLYINSRSFSNEPAFDKVNKPDSLSLNDSEFKEYANKYYTINYPSDLLAIEDESRCDGNNCSEFFTSFINEKYYVADYNNTVNRIEVYPNTDLKSMDLKILNKEFVSMDNYSFVTGINTDWIGGKSYWLEGNGYTLRIVYKTPKEDSTYSRYIDLGTLKLRTR